MTDLHPDYDFGFEDIPREKTWDAVFNVIDENFSKVGNYFLKLGARIHVDSFVAITDDEEFFLTSTYTPRRNSIAVYRNGVRQFIGSDFKETSEKSFTVIPPCDNGDHIVAFYLAYYIKDDIRDIDQVLLDELEEARKGLDGKEYGSLSDAVRGQISMYATRADERSRQVQEEVLADQERNNADQKVNNADQDQNDTDQSKNNADQAANNAAALGLQMRILVEGEYDPETLEPALESGTTGTFYLVPYPENKQGYKDVYAQWLWLLNEQRFERVGNTSVKVEALSTDTIDNIVDNRAEVQGTEVLNTTGLSYYDKKRKDNNDSYYASQESIETDVKPRLLPEYPDKASLYLNGIGEWALPEGMFSLEIDTSGDLYAYYEKEVSPSFEYDEQTGEFYVWYKTEGEERPKVQYEDTNGDLFALFNVDGFTHRVRVGNIGVRVGLVSKDLMGLVPALPADDSIKTYLNGKGEWIPDKTDQILAAIEELKSMVVPQRMEAEVDWNTLTKTGVYLIPNCDGPNAPNFDDKGGGILRVTPYNEKSIYQEFLQYNSFTYRRDSSSSGKWQAWKKTGPDSAELDATYVRLDSNITVEEIKALFPEITG